MTCHQNPGPGYCYGYLNFFLFLVYLMTLNQMNIVTFLGEYRRGSGSDIGFIGHFNTQLVITLNYTAIANSHTSQITTAVTVIVSCKQSYH
jgi:hypothetical protein